MTFQEYVTPNLFQVRKNDFIRHIKQLNIGDQFATTDPDSDVYWHNVAVTAFK